MPIIRRSQIEINKSTVWDREDEGLQEVYQQRRLMKGGTNFRDRSLIRMDLVCFRTTTM
uniref:Uncharacterized protein n=1 Tax=Arundo donax TaxID=35708 RepID=A0A0A9F7G6_ARUDO